MSEITASMREMLGLLTPAQVAELMQMSTDWVYDQVAENAIPHIRVSRTIRFRPTDLQAYLAGEWVRSE